jgi:non-specific serine/threonine protein kinase
VVTLLLSGQSNRQIAEALAISERTAEAHVANILGKLGLSSRARVVVWAAARGLTVDQPSPLAVVG